MSKFDRAVV